jgi:hypothetical protein
MRPFPESCCAARAFRCPANTLGDKAFRIVAGRPLAVPREKRQASKLIPL